MDRTADALAWTLARLAAVLATTLLVALSVVPAAFAQSEGDTETGEATPEAETGEATPEADDADSDEGTQTDDGTWTPAPGPTPEPRAGEPGTETGEADADGEAGIEGFQATETSEATPEAGDFSDTSFDDGGAGVTETPLGGVAAGAGGLLAGVSGWVFAGLAALLAALYARQR